MYAVVCYAERDTTHETTPAVCRDHLCVKYACPALSWLHIIGGTYSVPSTTPPQSQSTLQDTIILHGFYGISTRVYNVLNAPMRCRDLCRDQHEPSETPEDITRRPKGNKQRQ